MRQHPMRMTVAEVERFFYVRIDLPPPPLQIGLSVQPLAAAPDAPIEPEPAPKPAPKPPPVPPRPAPPQPPAPPVQEAAPARPAARRRKVTAPTLKAPVPPPGPSAIPPPGITRH